MQELEKILEEIEELRGQVGSECTSEDHYIKRAWEHCLDRVEYIIRKYMNDGWIPVEERLPEDDDFVLVTVTGIYNALTFSSAIQLASYCKDDGWFIEGYPDWENPNVSAWRPLPEPYRPESETEKPDWRQDMLRKFDRRD